MSNATPETVLILEDDEGVARLQQRRLERAGYSVVLSTTADQALSAIESGNIDLLVLDNRLSTTEDGLGFYERLKAAGFELPVVMVTGYSDDATIVRALRAGVRDYIFKSIEYLDYLPEACRRVLEQQRIQREREEALEELRSKTAELQATTQQLWQAARLAGVGELAASIAHELNNPLATISLRLDTILSKTAENDPRRQPLEIVLQEVERMGRLVANLLQFSRPGREQVSTVDLREEIHKTVELTDYHLKKRQISIELDFTNDLPCIYADRQHLRQVFLNLITNAADAMPNGGRLTLRLFNSILNHDKPAIAIEVCDTGAGIPRDLLNRVFEPFFSTKEEGKGTGLGLAICKRIVQQHHGTIELTSKLGEGTTVRIVLPIRNGANINNLQNSC